MIVRTRPRNRSYGDFGFGKEILVTKIPPEELARRWEACPKDTKNIDLFCNCVFPEEEDIRVACKTKPWSCNPFGIVVPWAPPWGEYGAGCRYMPYPKASFLYGVGIGTEGVSFVGLIADPLQKDEIRIIEKKEAEAAALQAKQQAAYDAQLAQKKAQAKTIAGYAVSVGATGMVLILLGLIAKRRRKVRSA